VSCLPPADTLYLFGKVASNSSSSSTPSKSPGGSSAATTWQSCCVVVPNLHRSVLFVPAPGVFDDASGELAALEAAVAADPSRRMELLQVRCTAVFLGYPALGGGSWGQGKGW
jgi:hypothetical protein